MYIEQRPMQHMYYTLLSSKPPSLTCVTEFSVAAFAVFQQNAQDSSEHVLSLCSKVSAVLDSYMFL
jgi:hypothetical protein